MKAFRGLHLDQGRLMKERILCKACGQELYRHPRSGSGHQHKPGGRWCDLKPPVPAK